MRAIEPVDITGLVLAGGRGERMGGRDKGLQPFRGEALALRALRRLGPQVGATAVSANRHLDAYRAFGAPVWPDAEAGHPGPLAGMLAGLRHCATPWLLTVPCDAPRFPRDLARRLADTAARAGADIAFAAAPHEDAPPAGARPAVLRPQPVFCLLRATLADDLGAWLAGGGHKVQAWMARHAHVAVAFADGQAFANVNTLAQLQALEGTGTPTD